MGWVEFSKKLGEGGLGIVGAGNSRMSEEQFGKDCFRLSKVARSHGNPD